MAHEDWVQVRIDQVEELLDAGCELSQIVEILNNDGFMRIFNGKNVTEDFVFNACLVILAKRMEAKNEQEGQA